MLPTRDPPQNKRPTQTESKGLEKIFRANGQEKKARVAILISRQNRLENKGHKKRPKRTPHDTQGKNTSRRHKHYKHICTQHWSTQTHKENLGGLQKRY